MSAAQHAERILQAWDIADPDQIQYELRTALVSCHAETGSSLLEAERHEMLASVVEDLQKLTAGHAGISRDCPGAHLSLLRHLSGQPKARAAAAR